MPTAPRERSGWRRVLGFGVTVASIGALAVGCTAEPSPPRATSADPSGARTAGERTEDPDLRFGDGTYLDGFEYLRGVNVYSLIFAGRQDDVTILGEPASSYEYLASRGVDIVRLAVPWQRLQEIPPGGTAADGLEQPIDEDYLDVVAEEVGRAADAGIRTILDLHNGCTYPWGAGPFVEGSLRCGQGITEQHVIDVWTALAERFHHDERVAAFDIFNEPRWSVGVDTYKRYAQVAVDAIRATGDDHMIWVEGMLSDQRGRLASIAPDGPWIDDPVGKTMYSEHFYADEGGRTFDQVPDHERVLERLRTFADWCTTWGVHCSVGEVGWPSGGRGGVQSVSSADRWNALFEEFYDIADEYGLDVTYFGASSVTRTGTLLAYVARAPGLPSSSGIDTALSQAEVIERHPSRPAR
jgi:hypothetical protein